MNTRTRKRPTQISDVHYVDVLEPGSRARRGHVRCRIGKNVSFSTSDLASYCLAIWKPIIYDGLLVAAAVEFCDRALHRPVRTWSRNITLSIPVHDPDQWNATSVKAALHNALNFLTGDEWHVSFVPRLTRIDPPHQFPFAIPGDDCAIIPFSDGLDSRAVAGLMHQSLGERLIRVRLGKKAFSPDAGCGPKQPFASVPYRVKPIDGDFAESSARSRGFKFAMISGLAAYLIGAKTVIVPESGQGSLGPALAPVGRVYEDFRNHPAFTDRMESFFSALLDHEVQFDFPRLWHTKGETLAEFAATCRSPESWRSTWSCWQQSRHVSVDGQKRQCGICAACMLRRMSVHAAGLSEAKEIYVWENLSASSFENATAPSFTRVTKAQREYAIAGTLHLQQLARLQQSPLDQPIVQLTASQLARSRGQQPHEIKAKLDRMLSQHKREWEQFLADLGPRSFIAAWALPS